MGTIGRGAAAVTMVVLLVGAASAVARGDGEVPPRRVAATAPASRLAGTVTELGVPEGPAGGWRVSRLDVGRYLLVLDDAGVVEIPWWDAQTARVEVMPGADGRADVRFLVGATPVDSRFGFRVG